MPRLPPETLVLHLHRNQLAAMLVVLAPEAPPQTESRMTLPQLPDAAIIGFCGDYLTCRDHVLRDTNHEYQTGHEESSPTIRALFKSARRREFPPIYVFD